MIAIAVQRMSGRATAGSVVRINLEVLHGERVLRTTFALTLHRMACTAPWCVLEQGWGSRKYSFSYEEFEFFYSLNVLVGLPTGCAATRRLAPTGY